ncbi:ISAs1 family transposase [Alysiella crassa]|uniref:Transposase n=1 Tax=Alysiella crassa TaxID=153491 RepID=A0A376BKE0_9NEIS|nr:ISAs1 family transposase [Alysiella crassa]SSY69981.1 Transposase [Alysiella crassa]SSY70095.1 Transposase [Alysiella crassa]SSY70275.1 Transposase [Alysiella crassa]SSY70377.1 Transposase [Alysiella crassa]SSY70771.1 Transposase [Alysiella crassa]
MQTLETYFSEIEDKRRSEGKRYAQAKLLTAIVIAIMGGAKSFRDIDRFLSNNIDDLKQYLAWERDATPSHEKIRTFIGSLDFEQVNHAFCLWVNERIRLQEGDWVALDGKAMRSTLQDVHTPFQNFASMVSAFTHERNLVIDQQSYAQNKEQHEHGIVMQIIERLENKGLILTLDALHCQKKSGKNR